MHSHKNSRGLWLLLLVGTVLLTGCNTVLLSPSGDVAAQQGQLVVISTLLMLLIIIPVIVLTLVFAWRYRQSNAAAPYAPDWDHSIQLELVIWAAPLVIVIALGAVTWISTHTLDPYRALSRIDDKRSIPAGVKPLVVQVVALDWKWLFFYPDQGVAVVNELVAPVDQPIEFRITSSSVMNSLFIPALSGQVFAMPGMETKLHAVINRPGVFDGFSANYSGAGFTDMRFKFHGVSTADFDRWVRQVKDSGNALSRDAYLKLERPSEREPVRRYASVAEGLYDAVVDRCVERGKMCMRQRMAIDARGGLGMAGIRNLTAPDPAAPGRLAVAALCTPDNPRGTTLSLAVRD